MNWLFPKIAYAGIDEIILRVNKVVLNPLIVLLFSLALVYFISGIVKFLVNQDNDEKRSTGKKHMLWGIVGMFIMVMVFTIMRIILNTLGIEGIDVRGGGVTF